MAQKSDSKYAPAFADPKSTAYSAFRHGDPSIRNVVACLSTTSQDSICRSLKIGRVAMTCPTFSSIHNWSLCWVGGGW